MSPEHIFVADRVVLVKLSLYSVKQAMFPICKNVSLRAFRFILIPFTIKNEHFDGPIPFAILRSAIRWTYSLRHSPLHDRIIRSELTLRKRYCMHLLASERK